MTPLALHRLCRGTPDKALPKRCRGHRPRLSVDQPVFQRVIGQIAIGRKGHFFHEPRAIGADGLHTQRQGLGDIASRFALGQLQKHLEFPLRQLLVWRRIVLAIELLRQQLGHGRREITPPQRDGANGLDDLGGLALLVETLTHTHISEIAKFAVVLSIALFTVWYEHSAALRKLSNPVLKSAQYLIAIPLDIAYAIRDVFLRVFKKV